MTTKQIDYCIELARTLNFSRAADNMFVSQPTFSYQIKLLEEEIGFAVFERLLFRLSMTSILSTPSSPVRSITDTQTWLSLSVWTNAGAPFGGTKSMRRTAMSITQF